VGTPCPAGRFQPAQGASSCLPASPNFYVSVTGATAQLACAAGQYSPPAAAACTSAYTNLALTQTGGPATAFSGKDAVLTFTATNSGPAPAASVTLAYTVPLGASFVWAQPGCTQAAGVVSCDAGSLAVNASASAKIVVRPTFAGTLSTNANVVSAAIGDANLLDNTLAGSIPVSASPAGVATQRYRLFSPVTSEHLYTTDLNEYNVLGSFVGTWNKEGPVGKVLNNPGSLAGVTATPYYRLYNTSNAQHHWTTDANEYYTLILFPQYNAEGVDGFIFPMQAAGTIPLYRLLYPFTVPVSGLHHWTIDPVEYNALIASFGWIGEGGSGFVIP
jgi:hypothetical protein